MGGHSCWEPLPHWLCKGLCPPRPGLPQRAGPAPREASAEAAERLQTCAAQLELEKRHRVTFRVCFWQYRFTSLHTWHTPCPGLIRTLGIVHHLGLGLSLGTSSCVSSLNNNTS